MRVCALFVVLTLSIANGMERNLTSELNPGCDDCTIFSPLIYTRADGDHDTIHHIWDFTRNIPTMILAVAELNSTVNFKWDGTKPTQLSMPEKPTYSFAIAIDKLYEYNDVEDTGTYSPDRLHRQYSFRGMHWELKENKLKVDEVMVSLHSSVPDDIGGRNATIEIMLNLLPYVGYGSRLPHLIHTENTTLVDVSLVNLTSSRGYNASRFAVHYVLLSAEHGDAENATMHYKMHKSLDDEHTPGVFEIIEVQSPGSVSTGAGAFVQLRPVAYTRPARSVDSSSAARLAGFHRIEIPRHSTLSLFYESYELRQLLVQDMVMSFGVSGDGFYKKSNYTAWSYTVGCGVPPAEGFSSLVTGVVAAGLSAPVVCAAGALALLLRRRLRRARPRPLLDED